MRIYILRNKELISNILIIAQNEELAKIYSRGEELEEILEPNIHHKISDINYLICLE
jgi:hypothetical protein